MKTRAKCVMSLVAILGLTACGNDGYKYGDLASLSSLSGFRVTAMDPLDQAENVDLQKAIQLQFSQPIDPTTISNSLTLQEAIGTGTNTNISNLGQTSLTSWSTTNDTLVFRLSRSYQVGAIYTVTVNPTLKSVSGFARPLRPRDSLPPFE